jgi:hypothetical protein
MYYAGREINYMFKEQIEDVSGIILISFLMLVSIYFFGVELSFDNTLLTMLVQVLMALIIYLSLSLLFKLPVLDEFKDIFARIRDRG